ncbi:exo-beta-N-acetylmuramidase NamZ domain-containing protein [Tenacibaculum vairaonense]|uniref:exo-beta-N-acetylmuramidase NamZ family protein n=1 Tax=Tenacibaculum vairaonense TaxID=3137860 RepID=UPI0031FB5B1A
MKNLFSAFLIISKFYILTFIFTSCAQHSSSKSKKDFPLIQDSKELIVAANRTEKYLPLLRGKNIAIVANQTSVITTKSSSIHIVDFLHNSKKTNVVKVFAPEHGFRGKADAGETVVDGIDTKTKLPIISLYGKNKKPSQQQLKGIDVILFDIQDVGARFYTYISTLHYVMEACAETKIPVIVLDRPNPNAHIIDGPILEPEHTSFIGMHPVPVVYGMTIGEYGKMINGEQWLKNKMHCDLTIIPIKNYTHTTFYNLPIKPSPNLPNAQSINLYPSLCFFEGTNISVGRGTNKQFQVIGTPYTRLKRYSYSFTPKPNEGAKNPKHNTKECYGYNLTKEKQLNELNLYWLIDFYQAHKKYSKQKKFFTPFFTKLAGTQKLQQQIENGLTEKQIKKSWKKDLRTFKKIRKKYLIYD